MTGKQATTQFAIVATLIALTLTLLAWFGLATMSVPPLEPQKVTLSITAITLSIAVIFASAIHFLFKGESDD